MFITSMLTNFICCLPILRFFQCCACRFIRFLILSFAISVLACAHKCRSIDARSSSAPLVSSPSHSFCSRFRFQFPYLCLMTLTYLDKRKNKNMERRGRGRTDKQTHSLTQLTHTKHRHKSTIISSFVIISVLFFN